MKTVTIILFLLLFSLTFNLRPKDGAFSHLRGRIGMGQSHLLKKSQQHNLNQKLNQHQQQNINHQLTSSTTTSTSSQHKLLNEKQQNHKTTFGYHTPASSHQHQKQQNHQLFGHSATTSTSSLNKHNKQNHKLFEHQTSTTRKIYHNKQDKQNHEILGHHSTTTSTTLHQDHKQKNNHQLFGHTSSTSKKYYHDDQQQYEHNTNDQQHKYYAPQIKSHQEINKVDRQHKQAPQRNHRAGIQRKAHNLQNHQKLTTSSPTSSSDWKLHYENDQQKNINSHKQQNKIYRRTLQMRQKDTSTTSKTSSSDYKDHKFQQTTHNEYDNQRYQNEHKLTDTEQGHTQEQNIIRNRKHQTQLHDQYSRSTSYSHKQNDRDEPNMGNRIYYTGNDVPSSKRNAGSQDTSKKVGSATSTTTSTTSQPTSTQTTSTYTTTTPTYTTTTPTYTTSTPTSTTSTASTQYTYPTVASTGSSSYTTPTHNQNNKDQPNSGKKFYQVDSSKVPQQSTSSETSSRSKKNMRDYIDYNKPLDPNHPAVVKITEKTYVPPPVRKQHESDTSVSSSVKYFYDTTTGTTTMGLSGTTPTHQQNQQPTPKGHHKTYKYQADAGNAQLQQNKMNQEAHRLLDNQNEQHSETENTNNRMTQTHKSDNNNGIEHDEFSINEHNLVEESTKSHQTNENKYMQYRNSHKMTNPSSTGQAEQHSQEYHLKDTDIYNEHDTIDDTRTNTHASHSPHKHHQ